jgi:hypothetical protein
VRFVESGRFFQRVLVDGLQFASQEGTPQGWWPCASTRSRRGWPAFIWTPWTANSKVAAWR